MAAAPQLLTLRIKCKKSQNLVLKGVDPEKTIFEFLIELSKATLIQPEKILLLKGFPPKRIELKSGIKSSPIRDLGIVHQDTIIVEEDQNQQIKEEVNITHSSQLEPPPVTSPNFPAEFEYQDIDAAIVSSKMEINTRDGLVLRKVVPSDNSCMFRSILYCMSETHDTNSMDATTELRSLIAATVRSNPTKYNEAFLGRSNSSYADWIMKQDSWGGGIELAILSDYYGVEIVVMDTQHTRFNRFGEDKNYDRCIYVIYDGIHYDALFWESYDGSMIVTQFSPLDEHMRSMVMQLGVEAKASHQFTDMKNFQLRCNDCGQKISGQEDAQQHAKKTGHTHFDEIQEHNYL